MAVNTEQGYHEIKRSDRSPRDHCEVGTRGYVGVRSAIRAVRSTV
jgi:hypothetical protein